tara:strand:+ start:2039 stop:2311 length:273 start_codon:yes stop_codon:yes gene_type:complete
MVAHDNWQLEILAQQQPHNSRHTGIFNDRVNKPFFVQNALRFTLRMLIKVCHRFLVELVRNNLLEHDVTILAEVDDLLVRHGWLAVMGLT